jgi:hypothetical protein
MQFTRSGQILWFEFQIWNQTWPGLTGADRSGYVASSHWLIPFWLKDLFCTLGSRSYGRREKRGGSPWGSSMVRFCGQGVDADGSLVTTGVGEEVDEVRRVLVSPQVALSSRLPSCNVDWRRPEMEAVSVRCRRGWSHWFAGKSDKRMVSPWRGVNSTNVLDEGFRIGEIGRQMNSKVNSVKQGRDESKLGCWTWLAFNLSHTVPSWPLYIGGQVSRWWGHPIYWYNRCTYSGTHTRTHHSSSC